MLHYKHNNKTTENKMKIMIGDLLKQDNGKRGYTILIITEQRDNGWLCKVLSNTRTDFIIPNKFWVSTVALQNAWTKMV